MVKKKLPAIISATLGALALSPDSYAVPCPIPSGGVITILSGTMVDAVQADGCVVPDATAIVVNSGGAIDFDQVAFFNDDGIAGIRVLTGNTATSITVSGIIDIGNVNHRYGINIEGTVSGNVEITATGSVTATASSSGPAITTGTGLGGSLLNAGSLHGSTYGADLSGDLPNIENSGSMTGDTSGIRLLIANTTTFTNTGTISRTGTTSAGGPAMDVFSDTLTTLNNTSPGTITSTLGTPALSLNSVMMESLNNTGTISASGTSNFFVATGLLLSGNTTITTLDNFGTISGSGMGGQGIHVNGGTITTLTNSANITGDVDGIRLEYGTFYSTSVVPAIISTLTNLGSITGNSGSDINNIDGKLTTLNNLQGGGNALSYTGNLPSNYNIIFDGASTYGVLNVSMISEKSENMQFGIDLSNSTGIPNNTLVTGVLIGVSEAQLGGSPIDGLISGHSGSYTWQLQETAVSGTWNLCIGTSCAQGPISSSGPKTIPVLSFGWLMFLSGLLGAVGMRFKGFLRLPRS